MKKIFEEFEMLSNHQKSYRPTVGTDVRNILTRRYEAFKFIKLGIHTEDENKKALQLVERLLDISNSKHKNKKDEWLLKKLVPKIIKFEKIYE